MATMISSGTRVETVTGDVVSTITIKGQTLAPARRTRHRVTGSGGTTDTETTYQAGDGMISARSSFGRESVSVRTLANSAGAWTTTTIHPDGTQTHTAISKGGLEQTTSFRNTAAADISSTTTVRNALGRLLSSTDSRTATTAGATTYSDYTPAGQAKQVNVPKVIPSATTPSGFRITRYAFDAMGRTLSVNAPDPAIPGPRSSNPIYYSYYPTGQLEAQWGPQTNPAYYL